MTIISEGLLPYLNSGDITKIAQNVKKMLEQHGGAWITDIATRKALKNYEQSYEDHSVELFGNLYSKSNVDFDEVGFENGHEAQQFFEELGFEVVKVYLNLVKNELDTPNKKSLDPDRINYFLSSPAVWLLTLKDKEKTEKEYQTFNKIVEKNNNPMILKYLESSKKTYESHNMQFGQIEIAKDLFSARSEFEAKEDMQSYEGVMHGGLSAYIADSVAGALALSRVEVGYSPLTTSFNLEYKLPCRVGKKYIVEAKVVEIELNREKYDFLVSDKDDKKTIVRGSIVFKKKKDFK